LSDETRDEVLGAHRRPAATAGSSRIWAAGLLLCSGAVLAVAAWLPPDARGHGTHEALGLGPCGMLVTTGLPCPTCGMTTAYAYTVRGRWIRAFLAQPGGFALALATIVIAAGSVWTLLTGRTPPLSVPLITPYRLFAALLVIFLGGWGLKLAVGLLDGTLPLR